MTILDQAHQLANAGRMQEALALVERAAEAPHVDALPGVTNQRHWTALVYLNAGYRGGATRFDKIGIEFSGDPGDVLIFKNVDEAGRGDPMTQHAGLPVTHGVKWLATRWIRQSIYHPWM